MPDLSGQLSVLPLKDLVVHLGTRRLSGALQVEYGDVQKCVFLKDGVVVHASSNQTREYLGQFLMNLGLLTEEQFYQAYATQKTTHIPLGQIVVDDGLVSEQVLCSALQAKFRETLLDAFAWDDGLFSYDSGATRPEPYRLAAAVELLEIAKEAEYRDSVWPAIREVFPTGRLCLDVTEGRLPEGLTTGSLDARLLEMASGGLTLDEMALTLHASDYFLYPRLYALYRLGCLTVKGPPADLATPPSVEPLLETEGELLARLRIQLRSDPLVPRLLLSFSAMRATVTKPAERYLLSRVDGERELGLIVDVAPFSELEALTLLDGLRERGIIELVRRPPSLNAVQLRARDRQC